MKKKTVLKILASIGIYILCIVVVFVGSQFTYKIEQKVFGDASPLYDIIDLRYKDAEGGHVHSFNRTVTEPTCTQSGKITERCTTCGHVFISYYADKLGHDFYIKDEKPSTCVSSGYIDKACHRCNYTEHQVLQAAHTWGYSKCTATCEKPGKGYNQRCTVCGAKGEAEVEVEALGHIPVEEYIYLPSGHRVLFRHCERVAYDSLWHQDLIEVDYAKQYVYQQLGKYENGADYQRLYRTFFSLCTKAINSDDNLETVASTTDEPFNMTSSEYTAVTQIFFDNNPQFYCFRHAWQYSRLTGSDGVKTTIYITLRDAYQNGEKRRQATEKIAHYLNEMLCWNTEGFEAKELCKKIHDKVCDQMSYYHTDINIDWAHDIDGPILRNYGVCEAYAKLYLALSLYTPLNTVCDVGVGNKSYHAWNAVYIGNKWLYIDCTWDDECEVIKYDWPHVFGHKVKITVYDYFLKDFSDFGAHKKGTTDPKGILEDNTDSVDWRKIFTIPL